MRKILIAGLICLIPFLSYAGVVERYSTYSTGSSVTATNLNGNLDAPINEINGGLDNNNADTANGFRFYEVKGSNPTAGTEGRLIYRTDVDHLVTDNGTVFSSIYLGIPLLGCDTGTTITEFSTDGTLSGNSDDAVPTEKALVTKFANYFLNTTNSFTGTATFNNSGNANIISIANTGTGYDIYSLDSGSSGYALWAEKTNATTATTFVKFVHAEHGSDIVINFQTENDSGTEKNFSITADPDADHLQLATDVDVTGELTAGTKTFKIDHPLAPHDKFYYHGVVESPKFGLIYDGKITLTAGQASINLDEYYGQTAGTFEAVVRKDTRRVFLQNNDTWDLVKGSVADGVLTVVADKSNSTATIDWMVTGERADSFAIDSKLTDDDGRFILEVDKPSLDEDDLAKIANPDEEESLKFPNKKGYLRHPKKIKKNK